MILNSYSVVWCGNRLDRLWRGNPLDMGVPRGFSRALESFRTEGTFKSGWDAANQSGVKGRSAGLESELKLAMLPGKMAGQLPVATSLGLPDYQIGLPSLSRKTKVSFPRWISRAKMESTSSNFTLEPMTSSSSPLLKTRS